VHVEVLDVTDYAAVAALPERLPCCFKDVAVLVNNAGLALGTDSVDKNKIRDAETVMNTNVLGVVAFSSAFIPGMLARQEGHVINVGSVAGHHAYKNGTVYNASKFAIRGFTEAAMVDLVAR
jgi:NADP-dependent 3-hydroxy acid dehydrogenase YdfG